MFFFICLTRSFIIRKPKVPFAYTIFLFGMCNVAWVYGFNFATLRSMSSEACVYSVNRLLARLARLTG
jgi:hypothetical protein